MLRAVMHASVNGSAPHDHHTMITEGTMITESKVFLREPPGRLILPLADSSQHATLIVPVRGLVVGYRHSRDLLMLC